MSRARSVLPASLLFAAFFCLPIEAAESCFDCHSDADNVGGAELVIQDAAWQATVHGAAGVGCADCHTGKADYPHAADQPAAACANCHDSADALAASAHAAGGPGAARPICAACHGSLHAMVPLADPASPMHATRQPATCGACHADPKLAEAAGVRLVQPIAAYTASVHARGVSAGEHAATCTSCHGGHDILASHDSRSRVHRENVPATCGGCHAEITKTFNESVHGVAAAKGIRESPVCTDCHGEHDILGPADKGSPVFATNMPRVTCGRCHGDLRVTSKFGMKADAVTAFQDSFHGLASRSGSVTVASCASCHGVHDILPSRDPKSHIHASNLAATCGSCHPGAGATFAIGAVHVLPKDKEGGLPAAYWIRAVYLWLIAFTIGGMLLHNGLDFYRKARMPSVRSLSSPDDAPLRLDLGFRIAHALMAGSFIVLVYTGFALTYPEAWWSRPLAPLGGDVDLRGLIHRIAAVAMLGSALVHVVHLARNRRARACIGAMVPNRHDLHELKDRIAFLTGRTKSLPESPWVGYPEKMEYLAVVWGTLVMSATGFVLWFENAALRFVPKWVTDVATVIHFWEAVLAGLAILVWHFYLVIFDPVVYPVDPAFWTGRSAPGREYERRNAKVPD